MTKKIKLGLSLLILLTACFAPALVFADTGPKPSADFKVTWNGQAVPDASFKASMLYCQDTKNEDFAEGLVEPLKINEFDQGKNCYWQPARMAWGGDCENGECSFSYMVPSEFRLAVYLPSQNKVYLSPQTTREGFNSTFTADLRSDGTISLQEKKTITPINNIINNNDNNKSSLISFGMALAITMVLELAVAAVFLAVTKKPGKILIAVVLGNLITLPVVWFLLPLLVSMLPAIVIGEIFAFVFESYFIYWLNKKTINLRKAYLLSLFMNFTSLVAGGFLFLWLSYIFKLS